MNEQPGVTIPLSLGEIFAALCPDCQRAVVDLVSRKAGPDFIRRAVEAQLAAAAHPGPGGGPADEPR